MADEEMRMLGEDDDEEMRMLGDEDDDAAPAPAAAARAGSDNERGEGVMSDDTHDSSEEDEDDDPEEARRIAEGFIVDEDESRVRKSKGKRRKKHRRRGEDDVGALDEDDLDLLEQNTGRKVERPNAPPKLVRRRSASEDIDRDDAPSGPQRGDDLSHMFDDDENAQEIDPALRGQVAAELVDGYGDDDEDDMRGFIEEDEEDEAERADREAREKRRAEQRGRPRATGLAGFGNVSKEQWQTIQDVFGTGDEYAWAMTVDDEAERVKPTLESVYEPAEIEERMLTAADDAIRALDMPERLQTSTAALLAARGIKLQAEPLIDESELGLAAEWVAMRVSAAKTHAFLIDRDDGTAPPLRDDYLEAIGKVVSFVCNEFFEVPFIWLHRRDHLIRFDANDPDEGSRDIELVSHDELYRIETLALQFAALAERRAALRRLWERLEISVEDDDEGYFEFVFGGHLDAIEDVADLEAWVHMRHMRRVKELREQDQAELGRRAGQKRAVVESRYDRLRQTHIVQLAETAAIPAWHLGRDLASSSRSHFVDDPPTGPAVYADNFVSGSIHSADDALAAARHIIIHELGHDPLLRRYTRRLFTSGGVITVRPTERVISKIDLLHPAFAYKYLTAKPITKFASTAQFLYILETEAEGDIVITLTLPAELRDQLVEKLGSMYRSDYEGADARAWNEWRMELIAAAVDEQLIPAAARWARDKLRDDAAEFVAKRCADALEQRVEVAPYCSVARGMQTGDTPRVVAVTHGSGDPRKDAVHVVFLDEHGEQRDFLQIDNLRPTNERTNPDGDKYRTRFGEFLIQHEPHLIVVSGFAASTFRLMADVRVVADVASQAIRDKVDMKPDAQPHEVISCTFIDDSAARIYQHSKRADVEFPSTSSLFRYAVGLARYAQNPIAEYCGLGKDLTAVTFDPAQKFVDPVKLRQALDRVLCSTVCTIGVDINQAIASPYRALTLPYVAGLGPRKAQHVLNSIRKSRDGELVTRSQLIMSETIGSAVFMNCAAFLRIEQPEEAPTSADGYDVLDCTRIHPENYDIARKMASDAEEQDEEDVAALVHKSELVRKLMDEHPEKLDELGLDEFAVELQSVMGVPKRLTLYLIRDELKSPFREQRPPFRTPGDTAVFSMLTGETRSTLDLGFIVPVVVQRFRNDGGVSVRLDSGLEGMVPQGFSSDEGYNGAQAFQIGQTIRAVVTRIDHQQFSVELDARQSSVAAGDDEFRGVKPDAHTDTDAARVDKEAEDKRRQKSAASSQRRVIPHSHFHPFNSGQAEGYLAGQPRGECVVRPSSKGNDHLAITWKVDQNIYQHLDVLELDKPSEFQLGRLLKLGKYTYSDLDEVIVSHVRAMARKVEEMINHDKFKGNEDELNNYLRTFQMANPDKSIYAFGINRKRPGEFLLTFIAQKGQPPKTWAVKVVPGAFVLFDTEHPDITSLCNGFKTRYASAVGANAARGGGRTPYQLNGAGSTYGGASVHGFTGRSVAAPAGWAGAATPRAGGMTPRVNAAGIVSGATPQYRAGGATPQYR